MTFRPALFIKTQILYHSNSPLSKLSIDTLPCAVHRTSLSKRRNHCLCVHFFEMDIKNCLKIASSLMLARWRGQAYLSCRYCHSLVWYRHHVAPTHACPWLRAMESVFYAEDLFRSSHDCPDENQFISICKSILFAVLSFIDVLGIKGHAHVH